MLDRVHRAPTNGDENTASLNSRPQPVIDSEATLIFVGKCEEIRHAETMVPKMNYGSDTDHILT
jgi:hypothetical protein